MAIADLATQDNVVGTFDSHDQAERVVHRLVEAGVPSQHISIVAKNLEVREQVQGYVNTGDVAWGTAGAGAWAGGLFGLLSGTAFLWVPGLGPLIVLGPLVGAALGALQGGVIGGLLGAILGHGVEKEHIPKYQRALESGKFLVIVHGPEQELEATRRVMGENQGQDVTTYRAAQQG